VLVVNLARPFRRAAALGLILAVMTAGYAFLAANAAPAGKGGDGTGAVSGYTATAIHYNLNATSPQNIDSVTMTLNVVPVAGSTMRVQLASGGNWYVCTNSSASLTCATTVPQATAAGATQLTLVVAD
jgi:hypothetical protein